MTKRFNKPFEISLLAASVALASCSSDNNSNGTAASTASERSYNSYISVNGGNGKDGQAGDGGFIYINKTNLADGSLEITKEKRIPVTDIAFPRYSPKLGSNPATFSSSSTLAIDPIQEPAIDTLYSNSGNLYISDGNNTLADETPVTGLHITKGSTFSIDSELDEFSLSNDLFNEGTINSTAGSVEIYADNYIGSKSSKIDTSGLNEGDSARNIYITLEKSFYNQGNIRANGKNASASNGGDAGFIVIQTGSDIYNSGNLQSLAGNAQAEHDGGEGKAVALIADNDLVNLGDITVQAGTGYRSSKYASYDSIFGGEGGFSAEFADIGLQANSIANLGKLSASGVNNTARSLSSNDAINGGLIVISARENSIVNTGAISANAGSPTSTAEAIDGGEGGLIAFAVEGNENNTNGSGVYISGTLSANGGTASLDADGGEGGNIFLVSSRYGNDSDWVLSGYQALLAQGGASVANDGGDAGFVMIAGDIDGLIDASVAITVNTDFELEGGTTKAADKESGSGGYISIYANSDGGEGSSIPSNLVVTSNIYADGGEGGGIGAYSYAGSTYFTGSIFASAVNSDGGEGGYAYFGAYNDINFNGRIKANGSSGSESGGDAGYIGFEHNENITLNATFEMRGGNAPKNVEDSEGGSGGFIRLDDVLLSDYNMQNVKTNLKGGTGETNGNDGCIDFSDATTCEDR